MIEKLKKIGLTVLITALFSAPVGAAVLTWDGGGTTNGASEGANWVGDLAPQPGDSVRFDSTNATKYCLWNMNEVTLSTFTMDVGFSSSVVMSASSVTFRGHFEIHAGTFSAQISSVAVHGHFLQDGGKFDGGFSTFSLAGSTAAYIKVLPGSFYHLIIDKTGSGFMLPLLSNVEVHGDLTHRGGVLDVATYTLKVDGRTLLEGSGSPQLDVNFGTADLGGPLTIGYDAALYLPNPSATLILHSDAEVNDIGGFYADPFGYGVFNANPNNYANLVGASTHVFRVNGAGAAFVGLSINGLKSNGVRFEITGLEKLSVPLALNGFEFTNTGEGLAALTFGVSSSTNVVLNKPSFGVGVSTNINASALTATSTITVKDALGSKAGSGYEVDPKGVVQWLPEPPTGTFTGDFSQAGGAVFDNAGNAAGGMAVAVDAST
ncbi:MAG: hypothetical protein HY611_04220, partial [Elusimicrobia bacterium]|nr:hypothetical protein [Elusimicrobiota bacterium]